MVHILDPNQTAAFALAAAVTRRLPPPLAAIEARRKTRTSSQSFPSSSCSRRTSTLSHCCDRTTSEMRGLSPKIISGDSRRSENAQSHTNKHTVPNMKFKLKLLQIKCHVLGFTKDKAQKVLQKIIRVFAEAFVSHDRHTLFALEESGPPQTTYICESQ
jgi:hypothetical protein